MATPNAENYNTWSWPKDLHPKDNIGPGLRERSTPGTFPHQEPQSAPEAGESSTNANSTPRPSPRPQKHWPPRTCRICFETVQPTFQPLSEHIPTRLQGAQRPVYLSEDPELGRLICPCKCKGSSKYVHEGCLQQWRNASPAYAQRNYWECPTCHYRYRLERIHWGRYISNGTTQLVLTILIFATALFILGFIADPIINFYSDPWAIFSLHPLDNLKGRNYVLAEDEEYTWPEHFMKGLASLGVLGFVQYMLTLSPWHWFRWSFRSNGRGNTGRDRMQNISWVVIMIGVMVFLWVCLCVHLTSYNH